MKNDAVVITGVGPVTPIGIGRQPFWDALLECRSGIGVREPFTDVDSPFRLVAAIKDFDPKQHIRKRKALKVMCREIQLGCAAANLAVDDANLDFDSIDPDRIGIITGTDSFYCAPADITDVYRKYQGSGYIDLGMWIEAALREIEPLWMLKYLPNMVSCQIGIAIDARGPNNSIVQGDASGLLSVIEATELIRRGAADIMLAGGAGASMNMVGMIYRGVSNLCKSIEDPAAASRPLDLGRTGMIPGEGAGILVLESATHAAKRGARVLARIGGTASTCATNVSSHQDAISRSIVGAMKKSAIKSIDHVMAYSPSDIEIDRDEAQAIHASLGSTPVTALKSYYGNIGVGAGPIELIASILGLQSATMPLTLNYQTPDPACPVNVVHDGHLERQFRNTIVLSQSSTGQCAGIVLSKS